MTKLTELYEEVLEEGTGKIFASDNLLILRLKDLARKILREFGGDDHIADKFREIEIRMEDLLKHNEPLRKKIGSFKTIKI